MKKTAGIVSLVALGVGAIVAVAIGGVIAGSGADVSLLIARSIVDLSAALAFGAMVFALVGLDPATPEWRRSLDVAAYAAAVWTIASAVAMVLTFVDVVGVPDASATIEDSFGVFATETSAGPAWLVTVGAAAIVTVLCFAVRGRTAVAVTVLFAAVGIGAIALQGNAAGLAGHEAVVTALVVHGIALAAWIGGVAVLVLLPASVDAPRRSTLTARSMALAAWCCAAVLVSGVAEMRVRLGTWSGLGGGYGAVAIVRFVVIVILAVVTTVAWRRAAVPSRQAHHRTGRFATVGSLGLLGVVEGLSVVLVTVTPPSHRIAPSLSRSATPAEILTDRAVPGAPGWFAGYELDVVWFLICAAAAVVYAAGVVRVWRRGGRWHPVRSVAAAAAVVCTLFATCGSLHLYDRYLLSANVSAHVLLGVIVPMLVRVAAPVALTNVAAARRTDGSAGLREIVDAVVGNRLVRWLARPIPAALLVIAVWWVFYDTEVLRWSAASGLVRTIADGVFVVSGVLLAEAVRTSRDGVRSASPSSPIWEVLVGAVITGAGIVGLGVAFRGSLGLLEASWFGAMGRTWGLPPLDDQAVGGAVLIGAGILAFVIVAGMAAWGNVAPRRRAAARSA